MCGVAITLEGHSIRRVAGDTADPFSRGHVCPKAAALADLHEDPDRLKSPVVRDGERWRSISWNEAFGLVAGKVVDIQTRYGREAVATYTGNPAVHNYGSVLHGQLMRRALSTPNHYSATSLDQLPHMLASMLMFGHQLRLPVPDIDRTDLLVMVGANPVVSNGSLMTAGDVKADLKAIQKRGGRIVVIDPRRTETADLANEHIFVRPGTDAALLAAIAHHILARRGPRQGRLTSVVDGLEALTRAVEPFRPDRVAAATGVDARAIETLAVDFYDAPTSVLYGRVGLCTQPFGGLGAWLINAINIICGRLDEPGGSMFPTPAVDLAGLSRHIGLRGSYGQRFSRVHGWPEFGGEFPTPGLADEILTPGAGQIRALITSAGNPVLSSPGGARLDEALGKLDFMASIDIYVNETTRHANVILPPTFGLEHDHYDLVFHALAVRNSAKYSPAAWPRSVEQRHDWEIYTALARRIARSRPRTGLNRLRGLALEPIFALLERTEPARVIDLMLRGGPHRLSIAKLKANPHGLLLGPLERALPEALDTDRLDLAPQLFIDDLPRLVERLNEPPPSLTLIGRRSLRSNNSWMHNSLRLVKGKSTCTLLMHPDDARDRGLANGQQVRVTTETGSITVRLQTDPNLMRSVVSLPHGWGHHRPGVRLRVAEQTEGASSNNVIRPEVDPLSGTARLNDVPVDVSAA